MSEFFFCVRVLHLPGHQRREFWEINGAVSVGIHFVDRFLQLVLCRILIEGSLNCAQLLGGLSAVAIFVEKGKGFLELCRVQHDVLCSEQSASLSQCLLLPSCRTHFTFRPDFIR